jgi:6-pyruvoyl-tetrahydropterin synthase
MIELFDTMQQFKEEMTVDFMQAAQNEFYSKHSDFTIENLVSPYSLDLMRLSETIGLNNHSIDVYMNHKLDDHSSYHSHDFKVSVPLMQPWSEGGRSLDFLNMKLRYTQEVDLKGYAKWVALHDWAWANTDFFEFVVAYAEHQWPAYQRKMAEMNEKLAHYQQERNQMTWKRELAQARALQNRALDIIENGYQGKVQKLFRKRDVPVLIREMEILRITPSLKSIDVRFVGKDFVSYSYNYIWRSGTNYTKTKEWVCKNVRISTLLEVDITQDFSESGSPYDPDHAYFVMPRRYYY